MIERKKYEAIVFDLGNVLIKIDYKKFLEEAKLNHQYDEQKIFYVLEEPAILYEKGKIDSIRFYLIAKEKLQVNLSYDSFYKAWCEVATGLVNNISRIVKNLYTKYPLYLLSNTNEAHMDYVLKNFEILSYFKEYFLSYKIGSMKPEKEIYLKMLKYLNIAPETIFYIDDKTENVQVAKKIGIDSYKFINSYKLSQFLLENKIME